MTPVRSSAFDGAPAAQDTDLDRLVLDAITAGVPDVDVTTCITDAVVEYAMTGAGILTIDLDDNERRILRSGILRHAIRVSLDDDHYRLRATDKRDNGLTLTFEDEVVTFLRRHNKPRVAYRDTVSRVQFAQSLVREVRARPIRFVTAVAKSLRSVVGHDEPARRSRPSSAPAGFDAGVKLKIAGAPADGEQLRNAARALRRADKLNAGDKATLAMLLAIITENACRNTQGKGADAVSWGMYQAIPGTSAKIANVEQARDIERCTGIFLSGPGFTSKGGAIALARKHPGWTAGQIAAEIEGPLARYRGRYDEHDAEGRAMLAAWRGGDRSSSDGDDAPGTKRYAFRRGELHGKREDSWTCLNRLADEVRWRCFAYRGAVWFISDADLLREPAVATLTEDSEGVRGIDFQIDGGKVKGNVTLTVDVGRYQLRPGMVIALRECGPADGRWLVENVRRSLFTTDATVTLRRSQKPLPEPPAEKTGATAGHTSGSGSGGSSGGTPSKVGDVNLTSAWRGSQSIIDQFVTPFMRRKGLSPGSTKRTPAENAAAGGSATSDHLTTMGGSFATDYPTTSGEAAARALARELGYTSWQPNSYGTARIVVEGRTFQVQILWGAGIEHGDHVHVGIKAV